MPSCRAALTPAAALYRYSFGQASWNARRGASESAKYVHLEVSFIPAMSLGCMTPPMLIHEIWQPKALRRSMEAKGHADLRQL